MKRKLLLLDELLDAEELLEEFDEKFKELQEVLLEERREIDIMKRRLLLLDELLEEEEVLLEEFDEKFKELQEVLLEERKKGKKIENE